MAQVFIWKGSKCEGGLEETEAAVTVLRGFRPAEQVAEGSESDEFWEAMGGKDEMGEDGTLTTCVLSVRYASSFLWSFYGDK